MTVNTLAPSRTRAAALAGLAGIISLILVVGPFANTSRAAVTSVSDEAGYRAAITAYSSTTNGSNIITLTSNIALTGDTAPQYTGADDLVIASEAGHHYTISKSGAGTTTMLTVTTDTGEIEIKDLTVTGFDSDGAVRVYRTSGPTLTITNCTFQNNESGGAGAAVSTTDDVEITGSNFADNVTNSVGTVFSAASVNVTGGSFQGNTAGSPGGGIFAGGPVTVDGTYFADNSASTGGAIYSDASVVVTDGTLERNTATSGPAGAIYASTDVTIEDSSFYDNVGNSSGGAVYAGGTVDVTDSTFRGGSSTNSVGGAVYSGSDATVSGSTFTDLSAGAPGGSLFVSGTLTVTDTDFTDSSSTSNGGAVYVDGDASFTDVTFTDTTSGASGGAISASSALTVTNASFDGGSSGGAGGAVNVSGNATITDSSFDGFTATSPGGALYASGTLDFVSSAVVNSSSGSVGGAIYAGGDLAVSDSYFDATTSVSPGGAIYAGGTANIAASQFTNSEATAGPGGALYVSSALTLTKSTFSGNTSNLYGGAIFASDSFDISNSTFEGNSAGVLGGALYGSFGTSSIAFSTFADNSAGADGAHLFSGSLTPTNVEGSAFVGATGATGCLAYAGMDSSGYNFDTDGTCTAGFSGTGDIDGSGAPSQLGPLADNGGPTLTMNPLAGSLLIDAYPAGTCIATDQRGLARSGFGTACDIGAVEAIPEISFTLPTDFGTLPVTIEGATCLVESSWGPVSTAPSTVPAGVSVPFGLVSYVVCVPLGGWPITVHLDLPAPVNQLWKVSTSGWMSVPGAGFSGSRVTYRVTDGGDLDLDGLADSTIHDPVAPGVGASFTG